MDEKNVSSIRHKADMLMSDGRPDEAALLYRKLLDEEPDDDSHLLGLAWALNDSGDKTEAIECFEQLFSRELKRSILTGFAYDELVRIYREEKDRGALISVCRRAAEKYPNDAGFLQTLGEAYLWAGMPSDAVSAFARLCNLDKDAPEFRCALGGALIAAGNVEKGKNAYKKAAELDPSSAVTYFDRLAKALLNAGYPKKAKDAWDRCVTMQPDEPFYYMAIGESLVYLDELNKAVEAIAQAAFMKPERGGEFWSRLGEILIKKGRHTHAAESYVKAIAAEPDNARFHLRLAFCYVSSGQNDLAIKTLTEIKPLLSNGQN